MVYNADDELHAPPTEVTYPERPERTKVAYEALVKSGLAAHCLHLPPREITRPEALMCHSCDHVDALEALEHVQPRQVGAWDGAQRRNEWSRDGWSAAGSDMYHSRATPRAARLAAGGVVALAERVCAGELRSGFAIVRPPGHHACTSRMCGFCFLNGVALAARSAVRHHGRTRVLIVDWDVHHGNGTQDIFENDPSVLYISLHRLAPQFFPGTGDTGDVGSGAGAGFSVNVPWRSEGLGDAEYLAAFEAVVMPIARSFNPQLVLVSAGFDSAAGDRIGGMAVTPEGFAQMARRLCTLANGNVVFALEGGYVHATVARCVALCVRELLVDAGAVPSPPQQPRPAMSRERRELVSLSLSEVVRTHLAHWPILHLAFANAGLYCPRLGAPPKPPPEPEPEPEPVPDEAAIAAAARAAERHECAECRRSLPRSAFKASQFKKHAGAARTFLAKGARCRECVSGGGVHGKAVNKVWLALHQEFADERFGEGQPRLW